jgi:SlyX protein
MLEKSIAELEIKFSHQDYLLDQLNKIVANQQLAIEKLQQDIRDLKLSQSEGASGQRTLEDDVPPHY